MKRILTLAFAAALAAHTGAEVLTRADSGLKAADGDFTASFTFRWNGFAPIPKEMAWRNGMIACHRSGYYEGWRLFLHDANEGRPVFEVGRKEGAVSVESGEGLSTGIWHRVAVSWQRSEKDPARGTMRLFADGALVAESSDDRPKPLTDASPVQLGYVDFGVGALDLEVADRALVAKALTEEEVREEYRKDARIAADRPLEDRPLFAGVYARSLRQADRAAARLAAEPKREEPSAPREARVWERTEDLSVPAGTVRTIENIAFRGRALEIPRAAFGPVTDPAVLARFPEAVRDRVLSAPVSGFDPFASYGTGIARRRAALVFERRGTALAQAAWPNDACAQAQLKDGAWSFASDAAPHLAPGTKLLAYGYWKYFWADAALPVEVQADGRYRTLEPHNYGFAENPRLKVLGVPEVLDRPGEWCVVGDRIYLLPPDEGFDRLSIPQFRGPFFRARGQKGRLVFRNVSFEGSLDTALELVDCADVELDHVTFCGNSGDDAVIRNCAKTRVVGSRFEQTGLTQLQVSGGDRRTLIAGDVIVRDCAFARSGLLQRTYTPCIRLEGCGGLVASCTFADTPSSAIRLEGNDHVVMDCLFERNVLESDDQGAIDVWGDPTYRANVFFRNEFRDVGGDANHDCGRNGIRFDDFISGNGVISNLFVNAAQGNFGAVNTHGGHYNAIVGNVFRDCARGVGSFGWGDERMARRLAEDEIKGKLKVLEGDSPYRTRYPELARLGKDDGAQLVLDNVFERTPQRARGQKLGSLVRHGLGEGLRDEEWRRRN